MRQQWTKPYQPAVDYAELAKWRNAWNQGEQGHFTRKMIQHASYSLRQHGFDPDNPPAGLVIEGVGGMVCPHCNAKIEAVMPQMREPARPEPYAGGDAVRLQQSDEQTKFQAALEDAPAGMGGAGEPSQLAPTSPVGPGVDPLAPTDPLLKEVWDRTPRPVPGPPDTTTPDDPLPNRAKGKRK